VEETPNLGGLRVALRTKAVSVEGVEDGTLRLRVLPGIADDLREYLSDPPRSRPLRSALAARLGLGVDELSIRLETGGRTGRVTAESARQSRLEELASMDPTLREAVEELDLTIDE
jgi:hypothetical protein